MPVAVCVGEEILIQAFALALLAGAVAAGRGRRFAPALLGAFVLLDMSSATYRCWSIVADRAETSTWSEILAKEKRRPRDFAPEQFLRYNDTPQSNVGMIQRSVSLVAYNPVRLLPRDQWPNRAAFVSSFGDLMKERVVLLDTEGSASLTALKPNGLEFGVQCQAAGRARVLASWTSGWWYRINEGPRHKLPPSAAGPCFMDVPVPEGQSRVELLFAPRYLWASVAIMIAGYAAAVVYCGGTMLRRRGKRSPTSSPK